MENLLFKDSEIFTKKRPDKLTTKQESELYQNLAQEIINNYWSNKNIEDIIKDLKKLSKGKSGYDMAKELEDFSYRKAYYNIDDEFVEWLDCFSNKIYDIKQKIKYKNVRYWIQVHGIKPKYTLGTGSKNL